MKKLFSLLILSMVIVKIGYSQTVSINNQVWLSKNLDVSTFRNGDSIPNAKTAEEWKKAGENGLPAWCYFENDSANHSMKGKLYNWYTINDPRGLSPVGWHIPSDDEWRALIDFLGGENIAGKKIKNKKGWENCEEIKEDEDGYSYSTGNFFSGNGTDEYGFSSLPSGERWSSGEFQNKDFTHWWTSTEFKFDKNVIHWNPNTYAWFYLLGCSSDNIYRSNWEKGSGHAVRLVMDMPNKVILKETIREIKIGNQIWNLKNLNLENFQNGDSIPQAKTSEQWINYNKEGKPAWCYYDFNPEKGKRLGKLYNWYVINDPRNIAPKGWHIPNNEEWKELINFLGGQKIASSKLKNTFGWDGTDGNNESGFTGLPGGRIDRNGDFSFINLIGEWWSIPEKDSEFGYYFNLGTEYGDGRINLESVTKDYGFSIRCIKNF